MMKLTLASALFLFSINAYSQSHTSINLEGKDNYKSAVRLQLVAKIQSYDSNPSEGQNKYDGQIASPKSVIFSHDGNKIYINNLEGGSTSVYSWPELQKLKSIKHQFNSKNNGLFKENENTVFNYKYTEEVDNPNHFTGKPVEMVFSHEGKFLWIPYYRKSFDLNATSPSAIAIIDTTTDTIVRVMPTGPLPKYVAASPNGKYLAVTHWGDNTIGMIDISSNNPWDFQYSKHFIVEKKLSMSAFDGKEKINRDNNCGFCLRGTVFTPDSRYLLVARMGGGGVAGFDTQTGEYLGTVMNAGNNPRHLLISPDGVYLFVSSNNDGKVIKIHLGAFLNSLTSANGKRVQTQSVTSQFVGAGARTIGVSPDGKYIFAAVNNNSSLVLVDVQSMRIINTIEVDSYAVGLAISPLGNIVLTTSQGKNDGYGNSIGVYSVDYVDNRLP